MKVIVHQNYLNLSLTCTQRNFCILKQKNCKSAFVLSLHDKASDLSDVWNHHMERRCPPSRSPMKIMILYTFVHTFIHVHVYSCMFLSNTPGLLALIVAYLYFCFSVKNYPMDNWKNSELFLLKHAWYISMVNSIHTSYTKMKIWKLNVFYWNIYSHFLLKACYYINFYAPVQESLFLL